MVVATSLIMAQKRTMPKELLERFKAKSGDKKEDAAKKPAAKKPPAKATAKKADPLAKARAAKAKKPVKKTK